MDVLMITPSDSGGRVWHLTCAALVTIVNLLPRRGLQRDKSILQVLPIKRIQIHFFFPPESKPTDFGFCCAEEMASSRI